MRKFTKLEKFLNISGICLITSIFTANSILLTSTLTLFIIAVILNINKTFGKDILFKLEEQTDKKATESFKNKKYGRGVVNYVAFPVVIVGIFFAVIQLTVMWASVLG